MWKSNQTEGHPMTSPISPLPWKRIDNMIQAYDGRFILDGRGDCDGCGEQNNQTNLDYVAQACNAYPKLVEALEKILDTSQCWCTEDLQCVHCRAREALRAVKENG
jgi:hypothetical protein